MANMSYCRFQNTVGDLRDCADSMDDLELSYEEARARYRLIKICVEIASDWAHELEEKFPTRDEYERARQKLGE